VLWVAEFLSTTLELSFEEELPERRVEYVTGLLMQNTSMVSLAGGLQAKSMTSQRYRAEPMTSQRATDKMADMRYYGNVMTTTRWRLYVTIETLWQQQDGGYALLWKRYPNIQIT